MTSRHGLGRGLAAVIPELTDDEWRAEERHHDALEAGAERAVELPSPKEPMAVARELVAAEHAHKSGEVLLRRWRGGWWRWETTRWVEVDDKNVDADAYRFTEHADYIDTAKKKPTVEKWAPNRYKIADLLAALGAITYLHEGVHPPEWVTPVAGMPPASELVSVDNGLLHVTSRQLYGHNPQLFNMVSVPFSYDPDTPKPVRWLRFLDELWPDDADAIGALQEFVGYIVSGDTSQHKILLMVGPRRGGKGTIARVLKELLGRGNYAGPTLASLGTNFGLEPLVGKSLAIVSDARLGGANVHQVVERLLSISGEDMLTIDRKYRQHWTGTLPTRFFVVSNELPRFGDASGAIASRFILLTLTRSWLGRENTKLTNELLEELPGILNWALDGLERLQAQGRFTTVASSEDALGALADLVSPVSAFVRECCKVAPDAEVLIETLYQRWKDWAEQNGHRLTSVQTFGRDLRAAVPALTVKQARDGKTRRRHFSGIRLRLPTDDNDPERVPPRDTEPPSRDGTRGNPLKRPLEDGDPADADDGAHVSEDDVRELAEHISTSVPAALAPDMKVDAPSEHGTRGKKSTWLPGPENWPAAMRQRARDAGADAAFDDSGDVP